MATPDLSDTRRRTGPGDAPSEAPPEIIITSYFIIADFICGFHVTHLFKVFISVRVFVTPHSH